MKFEPNRAEPVFTEEVIFWNYLMSKKFLWISEQEVTNEAKQNKASEHFIFKK